MKALQKALKALEAIENYCASHHEQTIKGYQAKLNLIGLIAETTRKEIETAVLNTEVPS